MNATFRLGDRERMEEIEKTIRNARIPPSNGDDAGSFPTDVILLLKAQRGLNALIANILTRLL